MEVWTIQNDQEGKVLGIATSQEEMSERIHKIDRGRGRWYWVIKHVRNEAFKNVYIQEDAFSVRMDAKRALART